MAKRLLLIDTTGLIFRAYYSIPPLNATDGTPVNAVLGVLRMLMKVFKDHPADACAFVFDAGRETFRNQIFTEYKAQRPAPPDDLKPQFALSVMIARATNAPVFMEQGFEADDLIATLTHQALENNFDVTILTSDRDIMQLLSPSVELLMPGKRGLLNKCGVPEFQEKYDVPLDRFIDFKALMGDPSDNIPGVPGVGEKTAAKIVRAYGKLEQVYQNIDAITPAKLQVKLKAAKDDVFMFRELVTLKHDVPVNYNFSGRTMPDFGSSELLQLIDEMGFNRIGEDARKMGDTQDSDN